MEDTGKPKHRDREGREKDRESRRKKHKREHRSSKEKNESSHGLGSSTTTTTASSYSTTTATAESTSLAPPSSSPVVKPSHPPTIQRRSEDASSPQVVVSSPNTFADSPAQEVPSLLSDKDETDIDRAVTQMMNVGPRITPTASPVEDKGHKGTVTPTTAAIELEEAQKESHEELKEPVDEILLKGVDEILKPEELRELDPTLSSVMMAEYVKICAEIEALEIKRQIISAYVDPTARAQMQQLNTPSATTRKRKQAPSPRATSSAATVAGEKRRKLTGYIMFIQDQKQSGEKGSGGIRAYSQRWKVLTDEEKAVWNKRAETAAGHPEDPAA
eukprot:Protomagalhaensia_sp_Gyna_25__788@NODE_137_length_4950_cov_180_038078_g108_i0_p2_GENE_NODE_137_length_4950_cov_180_038078_g108_i0NODE_137_length_4950_cov_180_038078_g108_i0_p2_ORF_typecomplete_len331_score73_95HMG_box_2/PF09011_10/3_9e03HMG_box_2/PF09011_10/9_6e03HMG_box_2/PF09011_10/6_2e03HMG_box_2/PF09011_10/1_6e05HMG_box/PF00505_19/3_2e03HMG_box/PF00505_19/1_8e04HMG_box/PF00505_19/0_00015G5/PF07501_12/0_32G5/PF07501_12/5_8e03_NODE_137_length_4950_cov_180_038078_g108_i09631955